MSRTRTICIWLSASLRSRIDAASAGSPARPTITAVVERGIDLALLELRGQRLIEKADEDKADEDILARLSYRRGSMIGNGFPWQRKDIALLADAIGEIARLRQACAVSSKEVVPA